jgi:hypothetical protein
MKNLENRNALGIGSMDQFLQPLNERRAVCIAPERALSKGFLDVDHHQHGIGCGHYMPPKKSDELTISAIDCERKARERQEADKKGHRYSSVT